MVHPIKKVAQADKPLTIALQPARARGALANTHDGNHTGRGLLRQRYNGSLS